MQAFEKRFDVPVIEIFGMTETAGVITSNPLPPAVRLPGSVGIAAGMHVAIVDAADRPLPADRIGEVVVSGASLMGGYEAEPEENRRLFSEAGFRTGDLGYLDANGYLFLTGRAKDMINRGGEKVTPHEVDQELLAHPAVADAACFPVPHPSLGEDVGAVVRLREGASVTAVELSAFLRERLAFFKIPRSIQFVDDIPRGANGKLQRAALAERFGAGASTTCAVAAYAEPDTPVSRRIAAMWADILRCEQVGLDDSFFALGGESLRAASFINALQQEFGETLYVSSLFDAPTVRQYENYLKVHYPGVFARIVGAAVAPAETMLERLTDAEVSLVRAAVQAQSVPVAPPSRKNPRRAVFVLSTPRSGSTLFRAMLGGNPALFAPPELYLIPYETLRSRDAHPWFAGSQRSQLEGNIRALMQIHDETAEQSTGRMAELEAAGCTVPEYYAKLQDWIAPRLLVDKTPAYAMDPEHLARIEACFDDVFYVHLRRHPYGVIRSFEEARLDQLWFQRIFGDAVMRQDRPPMHARHLAEAHWLITHENILNFLEKIPEQRKFAIRFEDVVAAPEERMRELCARLGVAYSGEMIRPQSEKRSRMTDGLHEVSRMIGDPKFHTFQRIESQVADQWKSAYQVDFLADRTLALAARLGYEETVASVHGRDEFEL